MEGRSSYAVFGISTGGDPCMSGPEDELGKSMLSRRLDRQGEAQQSEPSHTGMLMAGPDVAIAMAGEVSK